MTNGKLLMTAAILMTTATAARAATVTVTTTADENNGCIPASCSLREAMAAASGDTVVFDPTIFAGTRTISLTFGELVVNENLIIEKRRRLAVDEFTRAPSAL